MPCTDGGPCPGEELAEAYSNLRERDAMLCAVMTVLTNAGQRHQINAIDEKEAGVSIKQINAWWTEHLRQDTIRKRQAAQREEQQQKRANALKKLSSDERKLLGLK